MPRVPFRAFVNGSSQSRSVRFDQESSVNLYVEAADKGAATSEAMLVSTPGLRRFATLPTAPTRGLYTAAAGRVFCVSGTTLYELFQGGTFLALGTLLTSGSVVSFTDDGLSLVLVDQQYGYVYSFASGVFARITDPDFRPASHCAHLDGYTIFNETFTGRFFWSNLLDAGNIGDLNFATAEASPDPIEALVVAHRELWLFGTRTTEVWFSTGNADQPFQRIQGALIDVGCAAPFSAIAYNDTVAWLAKEPTGGPFVVTAPGYQPRRISTHAIEHALAAYPVIRDGVAWAHVLEGHRFLMLSSASGNATWSFDAATGQWHMRAWLDKEGNFARHRCHVGCAGLGMVLGGDWSSGLVYELRTDVYDDDGRELVRQRVTPWVSSNGTLMTHHTLCIDMDVGVGLDGGQEPGTTPQVMLRWSNDGKTWSTWQASVSAGALGDYLTRVEFRRLGQARRRIYEVRVSDKISVQLVGAWLELSEDQH